MATETLVQEAVRLGVPWYHVPGKERYTKAILPPDGPLPSAGAKWPIALYKGRNLKVAQFVSGKGPHGRGLGYRRSSGARAHAGVDVYGKHKDVVVACQDGQIVNFYYFYNGTYALVINHGEFVIVYGEVDGSSLAVSGLKSPRIRAAQNGNMRDGDSQRRTFTTATAGKPAWVEQSVAATGSSVRAGQQIAIVGKMDKSSMLHFEMYTSGATANKGWVGFPTGSPPSELLNPVRYLNALRTKERRKPAAESLLPPVHRDKA